MATLTNTNPTLLDWKNSMDPDGNIAAVVEILHQTNEVLADIPFMEGNLPTGHRTTIRTGLPSATFRRMYQGVQPDKSRRTQVDEGVGMLEAYNEVDVALADLGGNANAFRLSESVAQLESMAQIMAETIFFGNTAVTPERFEGLSTRYNSLAAENGDNIIDGGGTETDNRSIWLVGWGPETCTGIVPKGSTAGLAMNDKGQVTSETAATNGGLMEVYRTHFRWDAGLLLKDWRFVVRIANIDRSLLTADASTGADLSDLMFRAMELIPSLGMVNPVFYMSRDVRTFWRQQLAKLTGTSTLQFENIGGHRAAIFNDIPIRRVDRLAVDEARVV